MLFQKQVALTATRNIGCSYLFISLSFEEVYFNLFKKEKIQLVKPEFIEDFVESYIVRLQHGSSLEFGLSPSEISMG